MSIANLREESVSEARLIELYVEVTGLEESQARGVMMHLGSAELRAAQAEGWPPVILSERGWARRRAWAALRAKENPARGVGLRSVVSTLALGMERFFNARRGTGALRVAKG